MSGMLRSSCKCSKDLPCPRGVLLSTWFGRNLSDDVPFPHPASPSPPVPLLTYPKPTSQGHVLKDCGTEDPGVCCLPLLFVPICSAGGPRSRRTFLNTGSISP